MTKVTWDGNLPQGLRAASSRERIFFRVEASELEGSLDLVGRVQSSQSRSSKQMRSHRRYLRLCVWRLARLAFFLPEKCQTGHACKETHSCDGERFCWLRCLPGYSRAASSSTRDTGGERAATIIEDMSTTRSTNITSGNVDKGRTTVGRARRAGARSSVARRWSIGSRSPSRCSHSRAKSGRRSARLHAGRLVTVYRHV
jgi:hypothetical protein